MSRLPENPTCSLSSQFELDDCYLTLDAKKTETTVYSSQSRRRNLRSGLACSQRPLRRHVHDGVVQEEVPRPQEERHGLDRHDREVLRRREMHHAERVPQDDVLVVDALLTVADPFREADVGFAGCLRHMAAPAKAGHRDL